MKATIVVLFLFFSFASFGQAIPADIRQLIASSKKDTALVDLLNEKKLNLLIYTNLEESLTLANYIDSLARELHYKKGEARALDLMGDAYLRMYNYTRSFDVQIQSLKINEQIGDRGAMAGCLISLSQLCFQQGDSLAQLSYLKRADTIARLAKDTLRISEVCENLGEYFIKQGNYEMALSLLQEDYTLVLKKHLPASWCTVDLAILHRKLKNDDLALSYSRMAESDALAEKNWFVLTTVYEDRIQYYQDRGRMDSALAYARKGFALAETSNMPGGVISFGYLLEGLLKNSDEKKAFYYHKLADSVYFNKVDTDKNRMLASMLDNEKERQAKLKEQELELKHERKTSLELSFIFITIVSLFVLFMLLSHSTVANQKLIRFLGILVLLMLFEFINLVLHPYLGEWTGHSPVGMLLVMVCIAAVLIPLHHRLEHWITHRLVEKNNKIRLAAARKTIAQLGEES